MRFAVRDLLIVLAALSLWLLLADASAGSGPLADLAGLIAGAGIGATAYLLHEWGHWTGARLAGSVMHVSARLDTAFMFTFDSRANGKREFAAMTAGGFLATIVGVAFCYLALPDELLASHVARGLVLFLALLGVAIEVPLALWGLLGKTLPPIDRRRGTAAAPPGQ
jgi:hypothetical protein